ncbi:uncharacterized protein B0I36DRAFT_357641 [Microdochium trichocladiopsis]|uniref:Uncharacterized protein n=1 Tax=Microdochium trichocladiopsis TaxID=1682393 RepID=A0A9P8YHX6_9PEZI|nr:uncharacterized protein B0I36DRAFT_357641 [Microdochium trichocladiopsis]KAH7040328.1 hypothetical protein B0I36DRAFT_357641 [Microdochium trichocladiopsis]
MAANIDSAPVLTSTSTYPSTTTTTTSMCDPQTAAAINYATTTTTATSSSTTTSSSSGSSNSTKTWTQHLNHAIGARLFGIFVLLPWAMVMFWRGDWSDFDFGIDGDDCGGLSSSLSSSDDSDGNGDGNGNGDTEKDGNNDGYRGEDKEWEEMEMVMDSGPTTVSELVGGMLLLGAIIVVQGPLLWTMLDPAAAAK